MNRNRKGTSRRHASIKPWTYGRAQAALPYLTAVVRSLREYRLEASRHRLNAQRLANLPGRPNRDALIAHDDALREASEAEGAFQEAQAELEAIDVFPLQPAHGRALIPFVHNEQLAWFVYDLFDPEPLRFWRYQSDSLETRRPVTARQKESAV